MLFHDASGAPLYAPYPLHIAIPAMMIGHLTFAGLAELIVTGGVVSYLQRTDVSLLKLTAPASLQHEPGSEAGEAGGSRSGWRATRPLWIGLALLMLLTPLGLLATGTAWGEWGAEDFADPARRAEIAAASGNQAPPAAPPQGLARLASVWTAPIPDYAPPFLKSAAFGYVMSALVGCGLIILMSMLIGWLTRIGRAKKVEPEGFA
jgi:cobalt/nickel transport system permease protein